MTDHDNMQRAIDAHSARMEAWALSGQALVLTAILATIIQRVHAGDFEGAALLQAMADQVQP